tara:strand:+ start:1225 stop:1434 length:210 start_codon:yes stop_codon:yes gene_type:complete
MKVPNWQHHSKKEQKRTLKPQAVRQAKYRRQALKRKLKGASSFIDIIDEDNYETSISESKRKKATAVGT